MPVREFNEKSIKKVFVFFLVYLPLQYAMVGVVGVLLSEPWPTFTLPGFKNVFTTERQTKVVKPHFYVKMNNRSGDYKEIQVSEHKLFDGLLESQMQGFIRTHFSEPQSFSRNAQQWLKDRVEQLYPESESTELRVVWKEVLFEQKAKEVAVKSGDNVKVITISFTEKG